MSVASRKAHKLRESIHVKLWLALHVSLGEMEDT